MFEQLVADAAKKDTDKKDKKKDKKRPASTKSAKSKVEKEDQSWEEVKMPSHSSGAQA